MSFGSALRDVMQFRGLVWRIMPRTNDDKVAFGMPLYKIFCPDDSLRQRMLQLFKKFRLLDNLQHTRIYAHIYYLTR